MMYVFLMLVVQTRYIAQNEHDERWIKRNVNFLVIILYKEIFVTEYVPPGNGQISF